jgi:large conductance mechanosensitive channel
MSKIVQEFREFIARGNVIDLAVGVIMGAAFGKIVSSLVNDVIMPPPVSLLGKVSIEGLFFSLDGKHYDSLKAAKDASAPYVAYGTFLNATIEFLIIGACVFMMVKGVNFIKRKEEAKPTPPTTTEVLLTEIRDALKNK